jgi:hypothetical protein
MYGACDECGEVYERSVFVQANVLPEVWRRLFNSDEENIQRALYILYDDDYTRLKKDDTLKQQAENA